MVAETALAADATEEVAEKLDGYASQCLMTSHRSCVARMHKSNVLKQLPPCQKVRKWFAVVATGV
jgi:hypothetical protein